MFKLFTIFIHTPINAEIEAFGQVYIEALASKTPLIVTLSGIANEIIVNQENALVVDYMNSYQIEKAILKLLNDNNLLKQIVQKGYKDSHKFHLNIMINKLKNVYLN